MRPYELTNNQRRYFGLNAVADSWDRQSLSDKVSVYYNGDKIVKILNYGWGYIEYDADINTRERQILLPKTAKGKEHKLTIPRILKIKGSGIQFSGSFHGGGISVYNNKRNVTFIKSYSEDGPIHTYADIENWLTKYILESTEDYFDWLTVQLNLTRLNIQVKSGDILAFHVSRYEYGYAKIILTDFLDFNFGGRPLLIMLYSFVSRELTIDLDTLATKPTLKPIQINDSNAFYGEIKVIGFRKLNEKDLSKVGQLTYTKYLSIPYSKTDILQLREIW